MPSAIKQSAVNVASLGSHGRAKDQAGRHSVSRRVRPTSVTQGRKTGKKHLFPLFYGETGKSYFLVASKGGAPDHPGWYKNILANAEVELQVGTKTMKAKARTASGAERQKLWDNAITWWPPYFDYQKKTQREIPVVVLDPVN